MRISTLSRCHRPGRKRQIQASSIPTTRTASSAQPPKLATSGSVCAEAERVDLLDVGGRERRAVADDDLALADRDPDGLDASAAAAARAVVVSGRLNDEFGTTSGSMSSAASIRSASSSPPAIRPDRRVRVSSTSVSRSSVRSRRVEDPRRLGPDGRPAARRRGRRASPSAGSDRSSTAVSSRAFGPLSAIGRPRTRCRCRLTRLSKASCCAAAIGDRVLGREVVLERHGGAGGRRAPGRSGPCSRSRSPWARRCRGSPAGPRPRRAAGRAGCRRRGSRSARGSRIPAAMTRRGTSRRVNWVGVSIRRVSIVAVIRVAAQWVPTSCAARSAPASACATSSLTCLPSARPRVRGESQPMTLPMSRADDAPVAAIASRTSAAISSSVRAAGRYSPRIAISASSFAARSSRPPARKASTDSRRVLTSRLQHGQVLVVGQRPALALLDVVRGARDHPQDVATQRITAAHGGGDIGLDAILKGHRSGTSGGAAHRGRGGPSVGPWGCRSCGSGGPAQPTCVRAFFLRFASLRLRFTVGFS